MTNEEKIIDIIDKHFGYHITEGSDEWYTRNYQNRFSDLQEMAAWKQEQMIEKSRIWFENVLPEILLNHKPIGINDIFENFKKEIEE